MGVAASNEGSSGPDVSSGYMVVDHVKHMDHVSPSSSTSTTMKKSQSKSLHWQTCTHIPPEFQDVFTPALLALTTCPEIVIAGGAVQALATALIRDEAACVPLACTVRDVDIFVLGRAGVNMLRDVLFHSPHSGHTRVMPGLGTTKHCTLCVVRNDTLSSAPLQIIFGSLGDALDADDLVLGFDMDCSSVAIRQRADSSILELGTGPGTIESWQTGRATVTDTKILSRDRILNMRGKGFQIGFRTPEQEVEAAMRIYGKTSKAREAASVLMPVVEIRSARNADEAAGFARDWWIAKKTAVESVCLQALAADCTGKTPAAHVPTLFTKSMLDPKTFVAVDKETGVNIYNAAVRAGLILGADRKLHPVSGDTGVEYYGGGRSGCLSSAEAIRFLQRAHGSADSPFVQLYMELSNAE